MSKRYQLWAGNYSPTFAPKQSRGFFNAPEHAQEEAATIDCDFAFVVDEEEQIIVTSVGLNIDATLKPSKEWESTFTRFSRGPKA